MGIMSISGLLMLGAAQKKRAVGLCCFAALFVYLLLGSQSLVFFAVNISVIFFLSAALRRINFQLFSGAAILMYSAVIDIVCFYLFPFFPTNASLGAYVTAGLLFNLRSAVPAIILGAALSVLPLFRFALRKKQRLAVKASVESA